MATSSGNSSSSSGGLQNSASEEDLLQKGMGMVDERKRKRMQSNRESARRSRMRKQKQLDDLTAQVAQLTKENGQILATMNITTQQCLSVESENSVLKAQMAELTQRLQSLNDILTFINNTNNHNNNNMMMMNTFAETEQFEDVHESFAVNDPWNLMYFNQPIMASADMFQY